jgi:dTDP-glucose 4,6-dehydratase
MARMLVTGGAGFIGANFVVYWMARHPEDEVIVVDALTYAGDRTRLAAVADTPRFTFVQADIQDHDAMRQVMRGVDIVAHFAAETHVDRSLAGLEAEKRFLRVNVEGTLSLLHAAREAGVRRFHHVSTDEVFGDLAYDAPETFHETFPYGPHNPYAISKAAADFAVRGFARSHGLPVTISNCTNNYGPYQTPEKVIPRSIALLLNDQPVSLYTDSRGVPGPNIRDWLHVEDHCRAIEMILSRGVIGETYCVGGNCELSNHALISRMLAIMSSCTGTAFSMDRHVVSVQDRPGHDRRYAMNTAKIERELGWRPAHSFETGFRATVAWYLSAEGRTWLNRYARLVAPVRSGQDRSAEITTHGDRKGGS